MKDRAPPKYLLHKSSGQARVIIARKSYYLGLYGSKKSWDRYAQILAERSLSAKPPGAAPAAAGCAPEVWLVVELADAYSEWAEGYYVKNGEPTGHIHQVYRAVRVLRELYGELPVTEFGPLKLLAVQQHLMDGALARSYINGLCGEIRRVFRWGVRLERVPTAIYQALGTVDGLKGGRSGAREPDPVLPVEPEVVEETLRYLPDVVADMVRFQLQTGCRPGEARGMRPCDIDQSGEVWCYTPQSHKTEHTGRERRIFIGPKAQDVLRKYLLRDHQAFCFSPAESRRNQSRAAREQRKTKVQPSQQNRRSKNPKRPARWSYSKDSYGRAIERAVARANKARLKADAEATLLPHWAPNQLRHSKGTDVRKRFGLEASQVVLGHSNANVTQIYAERDWDLARRVARETG